MSSVLRVIIHLDSGGHIEAVLKLYDHRFGVDLRRARKHIPYTVSKQSSFESFVRRNAIGPFLTQRAQYNARRAMPRPAWDLLDGSAEGDAKYEAAIWEECDDMFNCETKAYEHPKDFQGIGIPRLLASVRLAGASSIIPSDLINEPPAKYLDVKGILLQFIPVINLIDLESSSINVKEWEPWAFKGMLCTTKRNKSSSNAVFSCWCSFCGKSPQVILI